jgi:hypothetical protein
MSRHIPHCGKKEALVVGLLRHCGTGALQLLGKIPWTVTHVISISGRKEICVFEDKIVADNTDFSLILRSKSQVRPAF